MNQFKRYFTVSAICMVFAITFSACKEEDPWVDAAVAPVLVDIVGAPFGYPQEKEPTVAYAYTLAKVKLSARLLELDKSNILNNKIGIDSIPVSGIKVAVTLRTGAALGEATSGTDGLITLEKTWAELGISAPKAGSITKISWSGTYKGIAFTRYSQVQAK